MLSNAHCGNLRSYTSSAYSDCRKKLSFKKVPIIKYKEIKLDYLSSL